VNPPAFPPEVADIATSLRIDTSQDWPLGDVLAAVIERFAVRRNQIGQDFENLIRALASRCVLTGKRVSLVTQGGVLHGKVTGISPSGELLLQTATGIERLIQADEVRILPD
jgi:BirA family transcriptional regulator, biotin operon repressor / biotin---[acetyl-CoA-carboxylase] ligase